MFFEQYSHEPNVATPRFWTAYVVPDRLSEAQRAQLRETRPARRRMESGEHVGKIVLEVVER